MQNSKEVVINKKTFISILFDYGIFIAGLILFLFFSLASPAFFTWGNLLGILRDATPLLSVSIGLTIVLLVGKLDLSVGSIALTSSYIGALMITKLHFNPYIGLLIMIILGSIFGLINAIFIVKLNLNALLTTMAMMIILKGVAYSLTNASPVVISDATKEIRNFNILGIPFYVVAILLLLVIMQLILKYTVFGRNIIAIGSNQSAAEKMGINVKSISFFTLVLSGMFAGLGAVMLSINLGNITMNTASGYEFYSVMAIVLGGTSLFGGSGSIFPGTLFGIIIVAILENGLSILGVDPYIFGLLRGIIILFAVYIDSLKSKRVNL